MGDIIWGYDHPLIKLGNDVLPKEQRLPFNKFGFFVDVSSPNIFTVISLSPPFFHIFSCYLPLLNVFIVFSFLQCPFNRFSVLPCSPLLSHALHFPLTFSTPQKNGSTSGVWEALTGVQDVSNVGQVRAAAVLLIGFKAVQVKPW